MTTPPTRESLLAALRAQGDEVATALRSLSADALARGAYEQGWSVRELAAHVASIEWTYARLVDLAAQEAGGGSGQASGTSPDMDAYNQRQVAKRAAASITELADEFARNRARTIAAVESAPDELLARPIRSFGGVSGSLLEVLQEVAVGHVGEHLRDIGGR